MAEKEQAEALNLAHQRSINDLLERCNQLLQVSLAALMAWLPHD
jgi:hypothetical protein